jgi:hypothetical protein
MNSKPSFKNTVATKYPCLLAAWGSRQLFHSRQLVHRPHQGHLAGWIIVVVSQKVYTLLHCAPLTPGCSGTPAEIPALHEGAGIIFPGAPEAAGRENDAAPRSVQNSKIDTSTT